MEPNTKDRSVEVERIRLPDVLGDFSEQSKMQKPILDSSGWVLFEI
ncbi:hypothetical protein [Paenibacillus sp. P3E]|nr:hypothetical protein [Paenibacillus sp. P3E]